MDETERRRRALSFGAGAHAYERSRPDYPDASVDWLLPAGVRRVLDLGAGTGKLTSSLVARGLDVVAVDPSPGMLARLLERWPDVAIREGAAEAIPLPDASVDAILVAQAWHWFDPIAATAEVARVLRPGGTLGLIWNTRDIGIDWVARLGRIMDGGHEAAGYSGEPDVGTPFGPLARREESWGYELDEDALLDLAGSRSAFLTMPEPGRRATLAAIRALFDEVAGASRADPARRAITLPYRTRSFRTTRR